MKSGTECDRKKLRDEAREKAEQYLREGNLAMAQKKFTEALDVTPEMAQQLMVALQALQVECYVAPYEADAQLAFMYLTGRAQAVITEDSDLLIFGVRKVFFKMDKNGDGLEISMDRLGEVPEFRTFDQDALLATCILSGCDYLDSIKGIGFKKALRLVYENGSDVQRILKAVRREGKYLIPSEYERNFEKALLTFKFQLVYDPLQKCLVHLNDPATHRLGPLLSNYVDLSFLGRQMSAEES
mmetsp:Transcript_29470/g.21924  ORF Transcript_29470/g.21924 Transcript_29470/m.21924 type:complete len:242 (-) Transcript_29470:59-784(-)